MYFESNGLFAAISYASSLFLNGTVYKVSTDRFIGHLHITPQLNWKREAYMGNWVWYDKLSTNDLSILQPINEYDDMIE